MKKVTWAGSRFGEWDPHGEGEIRLPWDPKFKERAPMVFAHELGHAELDHGILGSKASELYQERDAWRWALSKLPPNEIDLDLLEDVWEENINWLRFFSHSEAEIALGKKLKNEIMELARKKVG